MKLQINTSIYCTARFTLVENEALPLLNGWLCEDALVELLPVPGVLRDHPPPDLTSPPPGLNVTAPPLE